MCNQSKVVLLAGTLARRAEAFHLPVGTRVALNATIFALTVGTSLAFHNALATTPAHKLKTRLLYHRQPCADSCDVVRFDSSVELLQYFIRF